MKIPSYHNCSLSNFFKLYLMKNCQGNVAAVLYHSNKPWLGFGKGGFVIHKRNRLKCRHWKHDSSLRCTLRALRTLNDVALIGGRVCAGGLCLFYTLAPVAVSDLNELLAAIMWQSHRFDWVTVTWQNKEAGWGGVRTQEGGDLLERTAWFGAKSHWFKSLLEGK